MAERLMINGVRQARRRAGGPGYSIPEAAEKLNMSEWQVREDVRAGQLHAVKVGGRFRVPPSALAARKAELE